MRRRDGQYIHDGEYLQFIAQPTFGLATFGALSVIAAQVVFEFIVRRWLRWLRPIARKTRGFAFSGAMAAIWAGCGFVILRVGDRLYIGGKWLSIDEIDTVAPRGAPNPLRGNHHSIICRDGRVIHTAVEPETIRRIARIER